MSITLIKCCTSGIQKNSNDAMQCLDEGMVSHAMENLKKIQADAKLAIYHCRQSIKAEKASIKKKKNLF